MTAAAHLSDGGGPQDPGHRHSNGARLLRRVASERLRQKGHRTGLGAGARVRGRGEWVGGRGGGGGGHFTL